MPAISVLMAVHNGEQFLAETLASVAAQSFAGRLHGTYGRYQCIKDNIFYGLFSLLFDVFLFRMLYQID